jgi:hypothetical protein
VCWYQQTLCIMTEFLSVPSQNQDLTGKLCIFHFKVLRTWMACPRRKPDLQRLVQYFRFPALVYESKARASSLRCDVSGGANAKWWNTDMHIWGSQFSRLWSLIMLSVGSWHRVIW